MRDLLATLLLLAASLPPAQAQDAPTSAANEVTSLEAFLDSLFAESMAKDHVPGAVIVVVRGRWYPSAVRSVDPAG